MLSIGQASLFFKVILFVSLTEQLRRYRWNWTLHSPQRYCWIWHFGNYFG